MQRKGDPQLSFRASLSATKGTRESFALVSRLFRAKQIGYQLNWHKVPTFKHQSSSASESQRSFLIISTVRLLILTRMVRFPPALRGRQLCTGSSLGPTTTLLRWNFVRTPMPDLPTLPSCNLVSRQRIGQAHVTHISLPLFRQRN
jgi:hypothetical protein